ncbi:hypothetical protein DVK02_03115 [Halobellus sp. Atlit-31R]|nr:hypothetical protein DVK02_03115 [Halobellus sp. Atlit-31R]
MVEPREASELPELSDEVVDLTLETIGDLKLKDTETTALRVLFMWKSVAAENVKQDEDGPELPDEFSQSSITELKSTPLSAAPTKEAKLRLLEYYVSEEVM